MNLRSPKFTQPSGTIESKQRARLEPPYSAGDCGYRVIIIGLFYLALRGSELLENNTISTLLKSEPNTIYISLINSGKISSTASNAQILSAFLQFIAEYRFSFTQVFEELATKLRKLMTRSDWLQQQTRGVIKNGLWTFHDSKYANVKSIQSLEKRIADATVAQLSQVKNSHLVSDDKLDEIKNQAKHQVCSGLNDDECDKYIAEVINELYQKDDLWLDVDYLKQLTLILFGCADIFFSENGVKINGNGPDINHWYIDLPYDEHTENIVSACKRAILIVDKFGASQQVISRSPLSSEKIPSVSSLISYGTLWSDVPDLAQSEANALNPHINGIFNNFYN